jgi:23S rRNA-/tRNA-specific pseudouridylate synthase
MSVYEMKDGLRRVIPYVFQYVTHAKGRWLNRQLQEVLSTEFGAHPSSYWAQCIAGGLVTVNDNVVDATYLLRNGDKVRHMTHRHEPATTGSVTLVAETDDMLGVCKPSSLPMHPCGAYRHNSLSHVLESEPIVPHQPKLFFVHRLDRLTSGLVVIAKSKAVASRLSLEIRSNSTTKVLSTTV